MKKNNSEQTEKEKKNKKADQTVKVKKSSQSSVPFEEWYDETDIFKIKGNTYALICSFTNAGYLSKTDTEKGRKNRTYAQFLRELPTYIHYQEIIYNTPADNEKYASCIASKKDGYENEYEKAFFTVQNGFASGVDPDRSVQKSLAVLSVTVRDDESPQSKLSDAAVLLKTHFAQIGSDVRILSPSEVFSELRRCYDPYSVAIPSLPSDLYRRGLTEKDIIMCGDVIYNPRYVQLGLNYARVYAFSAYGAEIDDSLLYSIVNNRLDLYLCKHVERIGKNDALKRLRKQYDELMARFEMRKEKNKPIPGALKRSIAGCEELEKRLDEGEEFILQTIYITVYARSTEQLEADCDRLQAIVSATGNTLKPITVDIAKAFDSTLPLGVDMLQRHRILLSGEASYAMPFSYESCFDNSGFFYGYNFHNSEPVIINRKADKSSHGFVFGTTGSGKGMWVKSEISNVLYQPFCKNDEVICIDASGEYIPLCNAVGGKVIDLTANGQTHLNPLHVTKEQRKAGRDGAVSRISPFIALLSELKGESLTAMEKGIVDELSLSVLQGKEPTLNAFYEALVSKADALHEAETMSAWLKRYVEGSVTLFSGVDTDEDIEARMTVFSIKSLPDELRGAAMLACLDRIERRIMENNKKGKWTWLYIEEMHRYFTAGNPFAAERFAQFYAEVRKFGGIITGITQLPKTVIRDKNGEAMLSNSRFVTLGELDEANITALRELYALNDEQKHLLSSPQLGQYILRHRNSPISIKMVYPSGNALYNLFSTSFSEMINADGDAL